MVTFATQSVLYSLLALFLAALIYDTLTRWYDHCRDYAYFWKYYRGLPGFLHFIYKCGIYSLAALLLAVKGAILSPFCLRSWVARLIMQRIAKRSKQSLKHDLDTLMKTVEREQRRRKR